jgi:hypothetical protein
MSENDLLFCPARQAVELRVSGIQIAPVPSPVTWNAGRTWAGLGWAALGRLHECYIGEGVVVGTDRPA